jgi:hypothetical protein
LQFEHFQYGASAAGAATGAGVARNLGSPGADPLCSSPASIIGFPQQTSLPPP